MQIRKNDWTLGHYRLFQKIFGVYLFIHFLELIPYGKEVFSHEGMISNAFLSPLISLFPNILAFIDFPIFITCFLSMGVFASICLFSGFYDRIASFILWYLLACLLGRNPLIINPSLPYVGWMLLAHTLIAKPSFRKNEFSDSWHMPHGIYITAWILLATGYSYSGIMKLSSPSWIEGSAIYKVLENPLARPSSFNQFLLLFPGFLKIVTWGTLCLEISFAPLCLIKRFRYPLWTLMLSMHIGLMFLIDFRDLSFGMILIHFFTFNPSWIRKPKSQKIILFYDGNCGLCHRFIRFVLFEDSSQKIRFAPQQSELFQSLFEDKAYLKTLVISIDGKIYLHSQAVFQIMRFLGGVWGVLALSSKILPRIFWDFCYKQIALIRNSIFAKPKDTCPILPKSLQARFLISKDV